MVSDSVPRGLVNLSCGDSVRVRLTDAQFSAIKMAAQTMRALAASFALSTSSPSPFLFPRVVY